MHFVRKEKRSDIKEVSLILRACSLKEQKAYEYQMSHLRTTKDFMKNLTFVVESNGKITGFITLVKAKIMGENHEEMETLMMMGPFVDENYAHQGIEELLVKTVIAEAKYLAYHHIFALGERMKWSDYGFTSLDLTKTTIQNPSFLNGFVFILKDSYQNEIIGQLQLSPYFDAVSEEEVQQYQAIQEQTQKKNISSQKKVTVGAFICSMLFTLAAVILFVLRQKEIISQAAGLGSIVIAIGGCLGSIGVSYVVTNRKTMGWFAIFLSLVVIVLGIISIFN